MKGRPRVELDLSEVERLAADGLHETQIAEQMGVSRHTFLARKRDQAGVVEALAAGREVAIGKVENVAFKCAMMALLDPRYQRSMDLWLRAQAGWKVRTVLETATSADVEDRDALVERVLQLVNAAASGATAAPATAPGREGT